MSDPMVFTILLSVLLVLLAMGMWVALSLTLMAFVALVFFANPPAGQVLATTLWGHSHSWPLAALPLFILMGEPGIKIDTVSAHIRRSKETGAAITGSGVISFG